MSVILLSLFPYNFNVISSSMRSKVKNFNDFKLNKQILTSVEEEGYKTPTAIQIKAIPLVLAGHDILGIAPTGTGKTAAFVLPLLKKISHAQGNSPRALILAPTKELVLQIEKNVRTYSKFTDIRTVVLYGGIGPTTQINSIKEGVDIIVCTPGRLLEIYTRGKLILKGIKTLVLDEADKMMDMGFMPQIRKILEVIPVKRQNLLFSATMPEKVLKLSEEFLEFPVVVEVAPSATTAETIDQKVYYLPNKRTKVNLLEHFLHQEKFNRVIVFVKSRKTADAISKYIERKGYGEIRVLHSNKGQNTRINAMNDFKGGDVRVLVTTDVSSRGIDVSDVSHVINFDIPVIYEDYVHRIGRTGRALKTGTSITFVVESEIYHLKKIQTMINQKIPVVEIPEGVTIIKTGYDEQQEMNREIDRQKRIENPDFKGAFHEKKPRPASRPEWNRRGKGKKKGRR